MAGSVTQTVSQSRNNRLIVWITTLTWVGAASGGTVTPVALSTDVLNKIGGSYLFEMRTIPGVSPAVPPTNLYDIVLLDGDGIDILGGVGVDRSSTVSQVIIPKQDTGRELYGPVFIDSRGLTLTITGTTANSGTGVIRLYCSAA